MVLLNTRPYIKYCAAVGFKKNKNKNSGALLIIILDTNDSLKMIAVNIFTTMKGPHSENGWQM